MPAPVLLPWLSSKTDLALHKKFAIKILWRISASFILFILKVAYDIIRDSLRKMLDTSCSNDVEQQMHDFISAQDGVEQQFPHAKHVMIHVNPGAEVSV